MRPAVRKRPRSSRRPADPSRDTDRPANAPAPRFTARGFSLAAAHRRARGRGRGDGTGPRAAPSRTLLELFGRSPGAAEPLGTTRDMLRCRGRPPECRSKQEIQGRGDVHDGSKERPRAPGLREWAIAAAPRIKARGDFAARPDLREAKATPNNATPGWFIVTRGSARQMSFEAHRRAGSSSGATVARIHPVAGRPRMLHGCRYWRSGLPTPRAANSPARAASTGTNENAASSVSPKRRFQF